MTFRLGFRPLAFASTAALLVACASGDSSQPEDIGGGSDQGAGGNPSVLGGGGSGGTHLGGHAGTGGGILTGGSGGVAQGGQGGSAAGHGGSAQGGGGTTGGSGGTAGQGAGGQPSGGQSAGGSAGKGGQPAGGQSAGGNAGTSGSSGAAGATAGTGGTAGAAGMAGSNAGGTAGSAGTGGTAGVAGAAGSTGTAGAAGMAGAAGTGGTVGATFDVTATTPADGATGVDPATSIAVTFSGPADTTTLDAQTADGACSGSIQLSSDMFATCIGFANAVPAMSSGDTIATLVPAAPLAPATYQIKVTTAAKSAAGVALASDFVTPTGFTIPAPVACTMPDVVISAVYGGGGNSSAPFQNDFIELYNRSGADVDLTGWSVQYTSKAGTNGWTATMLSGVIKAGGYYLVAEAGGATGMPLPAPDATGTIAMSSTDGTIALVMAAAALPAGCPAAGAAIDVVGYGAAMCNEGTSTPALSNTKSATRKNGGCSDTNVNSADFNVATLTSSAPPHNTASPTHGCTTCQ